MSDIFRIILKAVYQHEP